MIAFLTLPIIAAVALAAGVAFLASLILTPAVRGLARKYGFVDRPDGGRKIQHKEVSLGGGVAVLEAMCLGVIAVMLFSPGKEISTFDLWPLGGLLLAVVVLCIVGLVDDRIGMRGSRKLLWQVVASLLVIGSGLKIDSVVIFGNLFQLDNFGTLFTLFWLLAAINSLNLIDGVDGLCTTVGMIFSVTLGMLALMTGNVMEAAIAFALAGALLGFLRYNFAPASIYLGDAGSMVVGLVLGTLAIRTSTKGAATLAFAAPLAVWAIPLLDAGAAFLRRKLTGRSMYSGDRGHIHHRLLTRGFSAPQAVGFIAVLCLITSIGSLCGVFLQQEWMGYASVGFVLALLLGTRVFGHAELMLINKRLVGFGRSIFSPSSSSQVDHTSVRLQGSMPWEDVWQALVETADRFNLVFIRLNVSVPRLHEDFYATWSSRRELTGEQKWRIDLPLVIDNAMMGRLSVQGLQDCESVTTQLMQFLEFIEPLQSQLRDLLRSKLPQEPQADEEPVSHSANLENSTSGNSRPAIPSPLTSEPFPESSRLGSGV